MQRLCLALLFAAACGSAQSTGATAPANAPGTTATANDDPNAQECHEETPLGSHVPRTVCRSKMDNQLDHQGAQEWHSLSNQPPTPTNHH
jgi:hypothetical protein